MPNNNIIKPSVLGTNDNIASNGVAPSGRIDLSELREVVAQILQGSPIQSGSSNTNSTGNMDQTIDPQYSTNLADMDKIPDVVKSLREFSGNPGEYGSWKKSVERILKIYDSIKGTPKYYGILSVIRNKITGNADTALESYNTPLNWEKISRCLTLHYADKRDLGTLEYQMTTLIQRNSSIPEFYQQVYYHLSLILNKLSAMEMGQESLNVMTQAYRDKALDTFIRGLKGDLPRLLSMRGPADLPEALHLCLKLENVHYRIQHSHGNFRSQQTSLPPPVPLRRTFVPPPKNALAFQARNFYPELLHNPQVPQGFPNPRFYQQQHQPPRNFQQYNQPPPKLPYRNYFQRPEPMDVDQSIHSKQVNYQNRPQTQRQNLVPKRPPSQNFQPHKFQRIHFSEQAIEDPVWAHYHEQVYPSDAHYDQTLAEFTDSQEVEQPEETVSIEDNPNQELIEHLDDIHFLD